MMGPLLAALLAVPAAAAAKTVEVRVQRAECGERVYTLDPARMPEERFRRLLKLSSSADGLELRAMPILELCVDGGPAYLDCGSRKIDAPNFMANARRNLDAARRRLKELLAVDAPAELRPLAARVRDELEFHIWLAATRLRYYETWDPAVLADARYKGRAFDCEPALRKLRAAAAPMERSDAARYDWHNCVNSAYQGSRPAFDEEKAWDGFLAAHGIAQRNEGSEECD